MEFNHGTELLELCEKNKMPISLVMKKREAEFSGITEEEVEKKMRKAWKIMKESARKPLKDPVLSIGGLIGGEAKKLKEYHEKGRSVCGDLMSRAITYAMALDIRSPQTLRRSDVQSHYLCYGCSGSKRFYGRNRSGPYCRFLGSSAGSFAGFAGRI